MAIIQCIPTQCKADLLNGVHALAEDQLMIALFDAEADLGPDTTIYLPTNEVTGTGYVEGGKELTATPYQSNGSAWIDFEDISWPGASFTAAGAMIYNATKENKAVLILNFGFPRSFNSVNNTIVFPENTAQTALMRLT